MGQPDDSGPPPSTILKSNVDSDEHAEVQRKPRSAFPLALTLAGALVLIVGIALGVAFATSQQRAQQLAAASAAATSISRTTGADAGARTGTGGAGPLPDINGISCDALESTVVHLHIHLAVFVDGEEQQIPFGVGIGQPWQVSDTAEGPFVNDGSCFYWIHTHTQDGILHIESPIRRRFTLGDFFAIWGMPLSATQVGSAQGQVYTYVNGQPSSSNPPDIALLPHERIQLDVGKDVPPYQFDFPPGD